MNNEIKFTLRQLRLMYYNFRYSEYYQIAVPIVAFLLCLLVGWLFLLPQIGQWFSIQDEVAAAQERIKTIQNNIEFMESSNTLKLDDDVRTAMKAIPAEKEFAGILYAISESAAAAQVTTQDYNFSVGPIIKRNKTEGKTLAPVDIREQGFIPMTISLSVVGNIQHLTNFIDRLEKKLPLSKIKHVDYAEGKTQLVLTFYSKELPNIKIQDSVSVDILTAGDKKLLEKLHTWNKQ